MLGVLFFAAISFVTTRGQPAGDPMLGYLAVGFAVVALVASLTASTIVANQSLRTVETAGGQISTAKYFEILQTRVIIRAAILEGAAFFCLVAYMSTRLWWTFATALVLVAVMAFFFPTRGGFDNWVRDQRELGGFKRLIGDVMNDFTESTKHE